MNFSQAASPAEAVEQQLWLLVIQYDLVGKLDVRRQKNKLQLVNLTELEDAA